MPCATLPVAFKAMKADQPRQAACYAPAPMWQAFLDRAYSHLNRGGADNDHLFINKNSLGEMDREAVRNYVHCIAQATRYFFHMNHDRVSADVSGPGTGLLGSEYPLPADQFRLLFRYPDVGHFLFHEGEADFRMDIFCYLYERIAYAASPAAQSASVLYGKEPA